MLLHGGGRAIAFPGAGGSAVDARGRRAPRLLRLAAAAAVLLHSECGLAQPKAAGKRPQPAQRAADGSGAPVAVAPAGAAHRPKPLQRPENAQTLVLPVTRDTWVSNAPDEQMYNTGGSPKIKLKSVQEMTLLDVETEPLKGRVVLAATLHLRPAGTDVLRRATLSTVAAEWVEGTALKQQNETGSSSFQFRQNPDVPWAYEGSDLTAVTLGNGNTRWWMADPTAPGDGDWQSLPVEPFLIQARLAGVSQGFLLVDDLGTEWLLDGDVFSLNKLPNRFFHSRESGSESAPYFTVVLGEPDASAPLQPAALMMHPGAEQIPECAAIISWETPRDEGPAGTVGFHVAVDGQEVPRYLIPLARRPGERVVMALRDVPLAAGTPHQLSVRAVDGAGNLGPEATFEFDAVNVKPEALPGQSPALDDTKVRVLPAVGAAEIAVVDALDKYDSRERLVPEQTRAYYGSNHLWSADDRVIHLHAARNEFVDFQVLVRGTVKALKAQVEFPSTKLTAEMGYYFHVRGERGPVGDPLPRLNGEFQIPNPLERLEQQKSGSLYCEIYVPHATPPGEHLGRLLLTAGEDRLELPIQLTVWNFTLPDRLGFVPELNDYKIPGDELPFYQLAHRHRSSLSIVPYSQAGKVERSAPYWNTKAFAWTVFDKRYGPLFDGSAFADSPRQRVPIDTFVLPFHENWPVPIGPHYSLGYWADESFSEKFRADFVEAVRQFASHIREKKWDQTIFQVYLNNKLTAKEQSWSKATAPWLLDEPQHFQDFWAVRYFAELTHAGLAKAGMPANFAFRADISRPQWQRDALDAFLDYNVVQIGPARHYARYVGQRQAAFGNVVVEYGEPDFLNTSNLQLTAWCIDAWLNGADGVLPWQSLAEPVSWRNGSRFALIYPSALPGDKGAVPSIRLKALLRGQQFVEYLLLLNRVQGVPRWVTARQVAEVLDLHRKSIKKVVRGDAMRVIYPDVRPQDLWAMRIRLGELLSGKVPPGPAAPPRVVARRNRAPRESHVSVMDVQEPRPAASAAGGQE